MQNMGFKDIKGLFDRFVIPNYRREMIAFVRGEGSHLWDSDGNRYIDLMPGWGTTTIGHCHPRVVAAIQRQAGMLIHVDNTFYTQPQGELAREVSERSFGGLCFFCNSGAEAVEGAIKLARLHKQSEGRYKIVTMLGSFHGRTMGAITATGQAAYHKGYLPLVPGFTYVPLNDLDAVRNAVDEETCAVMFEPIQGEGGVNVATDEFVRGLRDLCDERGALLVADEIQTGMGRTGHWFGYQHYGIEPDIMTVAKALGGGAPVGALVARPEVAASLVPGTHASTFGGNPLVCAAGVAAFKVIEEESLLEACQRKSEYVLDRLGRMARDYAIVKEVRGRGLMCGLELERSGDAVFRRCLERRVRINCTHKVVIRMLPALNIPDATLAEGLDVLEEAIAQADAGKI